MSAQSSGRVIKVNNSIREKFKKKRYPSVRKLRIPYYLLNLNTLALLSTRRERVQIIQDSKQIGFKWYLFLTFYIFLSCSS